MRNYKLKTEITFVTVMLILQSVEVIVALKLNHNFYNLQKVEWVQKSQSIVELNKCKQLCLQMKKYFPYRFRYHRLIYRQSNTYIKYFTGHCEFKLNQQPIQYELNQQPIQYELNQQPIQYESWTYLQKYMKSSNLFEKKQKKSNKTLGQLKIWQSYNQTCEHQKLKLTDKNFKALKLQRVHSDFIYYDNQSFQNQRPFTDIGKMLAQIKKRGVL